MRAGQFCRQQPTPKLRWEKSHRVLNVDIHAEGIGLRPMPSERDRVCQTRHLASAWMLYYEGEQRQVTCTLDSDRQPALVSGARPRLSAWSDLAAIGQIAP